MMKEVEVNVVARDDGEKVAAQLQVCECGGRLFIAYTVYGPEHLHLQCAACDVTHCRGGCADEMKNRT